MNVINTVGRRKESVAKVFLSAGNGEIIINKKPLESYFRDERYRRSVTKPLDVIDKKGDFNCKIHVMGGGFTGQAEAIQLGIARALVVVDPSNRTDLKKEKLLRRDPRTVESKKYGLKKARRAPQFSKR